MNTLRAVLGFASTQINFTIVDTDNNHLRPLRIIEANPEISQRMLASELGASIGKTHYLLRALLEKGLVKAEAFRRHGNKLAYHPQVILAGRRINDGMGKFIAEKTIKLMIKAGLSIKGAKVNVLGLTFKENCSDLRNSRVPDIVHELQSYGIEVHVHDPLAGKVEALHEYGLTLENWDELPRAEALIVVVAHKEYGEMPEQILLSRVRKAGVVIDVKSSLNLPALRAGGLSCWRL